MTRMNADEGRPQFAGSRDYIPARFNAMDSRVHLEGRVTRARSSAIFGANADSRLATATCLGEVPQSGTKPEAPGESGLATP
jgi:hypothetical protein